MKKATRPEEQGSPRKANTTTNTPSKIARILEYLLTGASLNRFEAEPLGDHCLNSTIAVLANHHYLTFQRQPEKVPNRWGKPCRVTRYSLPTTERHHALAVLASLQHTCRASLED